MGTTLTAVVVAGGRQLLIGHVGDSRAYLLHDGTLSRLTDDHSLVEELVREGRLTPEQAESHPQRAIVTRALGVDPTVEVDLYTIEVVAGDRILLCSDGLTTMVRERDIERLARSEPDAQRAAELLVDAANRAGGEDNTSVVVVDVLEVDDAVAPDPDVLATSAAPRRDDGARARCGGAAAARSARAGSWGRRVRGAVLLFLPLILILGSRPAASRGTRGARTTSGSRGTASSSTRACPAACSVGTRPIDQRHRSPTPSSPRSTTTASRPATARGSLSDAEDFVSRLEAERRRDLDHDHHHTTTTPRVRSRPRTRPPKTTRATPTTHR
jgi:hypothetical protein